MTAGSATDRNMRYFSSISLHDFQGFSVQVNIDVKFPLNDRFPVHNLFSWTRHIDTDVHVLKGQNKNIFNILFKASADPHTNV